MIQQTLLQIKTQKVSLYQNDLSLSDNIQPASFLTLFRFADTIDKVLMFFGTLCAIGNGIALPFFAYPYGRLTQAFAPNTPTDFIVNQVKQAYITFLINSVVIFLMSWFMFSSWMITSQRQSIKCRKQYFAALLKQQKGWYDRSKRQEIASNAYLYATDLQNAIGQKVSKVFMTISMGMAGFIIAYVRGWKLAIVVTSVIPFLLIAGFFNNHYLKQATDFITRVNSRAQGMAEEVLLAIKTVKMLAGQRFQQQKFQNQTIKSTTKAINYGFIRSIMSSLFFFSIIMTYTIGFWYGSALVGASEMNDNSGQTYNVADVIIIFFCIYMSGLNLGQVPQSIKNFAIGKKSASKIYSVLDRQILIQSGLDTPSKHLKSILFKNIEFGYRQQYIFKNFNLQIYPGKTAFVGESGCGKSTLVNLLMRFYDPIQGNLFISDGEKQTNWRDFDLTDLRQQIGYVGQLPVLIGDTIRQVVAGEKYEEQDLIKALKLAEAWDFAQNIGLDSQFGGLSGGQKQRIAIARALIKKPRILILDQATSALDRKNQRQIQSTLDKLKVQFMVVIAQRLQTIKSADIIHVLEKGNITQSGNYNDLIQIKGSFYKLAKGQETTQNQETFNNESLNTSQIEKPLLIQIKSNKTIKGQNNHQKQIIQKNVVQKQMVENGNGKMIKIQNTNVNEEQPQNQFTWMLFYRMLIYNKKYIWLMIIGLIASGFTGTVFPLFSSFLSQIVVILSAIKYAPKQKVQQYQSQAFNLAVTLFIISCLSLLTHFCKTSSFMYVAQRLSFSLKNDVYRRLLRLPMDYHESQSGKKVSTVLSGDCHVVNSLTSSLLSDIFQNATTLIVGLIIAFVNCWQITLVALGLIPILLLAGKLQMSFAMGSSSQAEYKRSHEVVKTGILNIETVLAFNMQDDLKRSYSQLLQEPLRIAVRRGNISGLMYGLSQMAITCILALVFFIGSIFLQKYNMDVLKIFTAIYAIMFAAVQAGGQLQFIPNFGALKIAAVNIFKILDQKQQQNIQILKNNKKQQICLDGDIVIKDISFKYSSRQTNVFQSLSLKIPARKRVALVGASGCGKSTILQLIQKIYEPSSGQIFINGKDIKQMDLYQLRKGLGVVAQQPVLFNRSVIENVRYNKQDITFQQIKKACAQANALQFIEQGNFGLHQNKTQQEQSQQQIFKSVSEGFNNKVGLRGSFLSGGQRQRIAIARAIVRKPKILLLDQATSALDTVNQKQVQQAIDSITGLTTIIVAHRLSTIQKCDIIYVFDEGKIVQQGTYQSLLALKGYFYRLANGIKSQNKTKINLLQNNDL